MTSSDGLPEIEWPDNISEAEKDELRDVLRVFDRAADDFEHDHTVIYPSEQDRKRLFHASLDRWRKEWSKPGPCMHSGCSSQSIPRSHTIPMSASLKKIAEQGHVVTPRFGKQGIELVRIGIRDASTFPGFCDVHEAEFAEFESQKKMTTDNHFWLQAFRTLCREIYSNRHYRQKLESGLDDYRKLREAYIVARMSQVKSVKPSDFTAVTFNNDTVEDKGVAQIRMLSEASIELEELYNGVLGELRVGSGKIIMQVRSLYFMLPVCLSGIGNLPYRSGDSAHGALCFIAVIPEANETKFLIGTGKEHESALARYMQDESSTAMLQRVESWMCHGSDHWFMTPSVWNAIPQARRDAICKRILDTSHSIAQPVEFSLLDGFRNQILALAEAQLRARTIAPQDIKRAMELVAEEKAKLNWVGPRSQTGGQP